MQKHVCAPHPETLRGKTDRKEPKKVTWRVHRKTKGSQGEERAVVRGSKLGKAKGIKHRGQLEEGCPQQAAVPQGRLAPCPPNRPNCPQLDLLWSHMGLGWAWALG